MSRMTDEMPVAVITGGSSGLGLACAFRLGGTRRLLIADVDVARLNAAAGALQSAGHVVETTVADITDPVAVAALARSARSLGAFGTLVHAAGLSPSMADGRRILDVNLRGTALVAEAFLPLAEAGTAAVLIASTAGHNEPFAARRDEALIHPLGEDFFIRLAADMASPEAAYSLSKRGVILYCEAVAAAWGARGARIMTVSPGMIETPMGRREFASQPLMQTLLDLTPLRRWGRTEDIAAAIEFLVSDSAAFITGTDLRIDGGITALLKSGGMEPAPS